MKGKDVSMNVHAGTWDVSAVPYYAFLLQVV